MQRAPLLELEYPLAQRVQVVLEDYVLDLGRRYAARDPERGAQQHQQRLQADLARTRKRLGGARYQAVSAAMDQAFDEQWRSGSVDAHREWIQLLLQDYYDPMYDYQMRQRQGQRLQSGSREELLAFAQQWLKEHGG
jgi:tRNA 2-selenouridine synthase